MRVEVLARELSVSKGSFYWHFRDRDELLAQMLDRWEKGEAEWLVGEEVQGAERPNPATRWARFVERASEPEVMRSEVAIHAWARRDIGVAARLAAIESRKKHVLAAVLSDIGFVPEAAEKWAGILLLTYQGWLDRSIRARNDADAAQNPPDLGPVLSEVVLAASTRA